MDEARFWEIIEAGGHDSLTKKPEQLKAIERNLRACSPDEVIEFDRLFWAKMIESYHWDLWAAAYWAKGGGCSDDSFDYFRMWLISRGRARFEDNVTHPDNLVEILETGEDTCRFEEIGGVARRVYTDLTGQTEFPSRELEWPRDPSGENWDFDDLREVSKRLPRIAARFLGSC